MEVFVARQPIFDRARRVYGYELLFRSGLDNAYDASDADQASLRVIDASFFEIGFEQLLGGKKAFINFTRDTLVKDCAQLLPASSLVVEVLENVESDDEVLEKCRALK